MRAIRTALFAITFLFLTNHVSATDYFVATTGSNSNNGLSSSTPFQTITKAVSVLASGDTAWVASGEYNETVVIWNKNNIALYGYGSTKPIIDGTGVTMNNGLVEIGGSTSPGTNGVIFEGFEVRDSAATGILIWEAKNVQLRYNYVHRNQKGGITAGASTWGRNDYITVFENTVTDNVRNNSARTLTSGWSQGIGLMYTDHGTIEGNYVSKNFGEGIDYISSDNGLIVRNEVWDNYSVNVYLDNAQSTVVDRNWIYNSGDTNFYRNTRPASGITAANENYAIDNPTNYLTIKNNIVQWTHTGFSYSNLQNNDGLHNTVIANNTFYDLAYAGIWIQQGPHDTTEIRNNIFYQGGSTKAYLDLWNNAYTTWLTAGLTFSNNCWYNGNSSTKVTGSGDVNANPGMVNAGTGVKNDYKLASTSPLINAGATVTAVTNDFFTSSTVRSSGTYDIGADEYAP